MYFGKIDKTSFDIRVRITNGKSEIAIKKGALHAHDRTEMVQPIEKNQFIGMTHLYCLLGFKSEVGERETYNFDMGRKITFSLVKAGDISYAEVEKMSNKVDTEKNKGQILKILTDLKLKMTTKKEFDNLCNRLSKHVDGPFTESKLDIVKLKKLLTKY